MVRLPASSAQCSMFMYILPEFLKTIVLFLLETSDHLTIYKILVAKTGVLA